jgi:hypothetical protein
LCPCLASGPVDSHGKISVLDTSFHLAEGCAHGL